MCNILNRNISGVHLKKIQKLFIVNCHSQLLALTPTSSLQSGSTVNGQCAWLQSELQWKLQQMSDIQPVTLVQPPQRNRF
jgi:hypothetical protein